jgi:hypothetical protein
MRANSRRRAVLCLVAVGVSTALAVSPSSSATASQGRQTIVHYRCRPHGDHPDVVDWNSPAAGASRPKISGSAGTPVAATIDFVTFGPRLHVRGPVRAGHVVELRLDVIAAAGTWDPDLRLDVDGARLLSCARRDLQPGRVTHLLLRVWVPRHPQGMAIQVTAVVRVRPHRHADVLVFRQTYSARICGYRGR